MNQPFPKLSVIIPSFNQGRFIEKTILSCLRQPYNGEVEIIVSDGGSTDNTLDILKKYDKKISWWSEKDKGFTDALNKAFPEVTGEYIVIQNSDDYFFPGAFSLVGRFAQRHPEAVMITGHRIKVSPTLEYMGRGNTYKNFITLEDLIRRHTLNQDATFFKASVVRKVGELPLEFDYIMDYYLWLLLLCFGHGVSTNRLLSLYTLHDSQKSFGSPDRMAKELQCLPEQLMTLDFFPHQYKHLQMLKTFFFRHEFWWLSERGDTAYREQRINELISTSGFEADALDLPILNLPKPQGIVQSLKRIAGNVYRVPRIIQDRMNERKDERQAHQQIEEFKRFISTSHE